MNCVGLIKFITGIFLALALLFIGGAAAARYLITRLTAPPPKPVFAEEQTIQESESTLSDESSTQEDSITGEQATAIGVEEMPPQPQEVFTEPEVPEAPENVSSERPNARITQPIGMVLRQGPNQDTTQIGGLYYNDEIIMLGESADGQWQNVRLPGSGVEGWIKAGNTEPLN